MDEKEEKVVLFPGMVSVKNSKGEEVPVPEQHADLARVLSAWESVPHAVTVNEVRLRQVEEVAKKLEAVFWNEEEGPESVSIQVRFADDLAEDATVEVRGVYMTPRSPMALAEVMQLADEVEFEGSDEGGVVISFGFRDVRKVF